MAALAVADPNITPAMRSEFRFATFDTSVSPLLERRHFGNPAVSLTAPHGVLWAKCGPPLRLRDYVFYGTLPPGEYVPLELGTSQYLFVPFAQGDPDQRGLLCVRQLASAENRVTPWIVYNVLTESWGTVKTTKNIMAPAIVQRNKRIGKKTDLFHYIYVETFPLPIKRSPKYVHDEAKKRKAEKTAPKPDSGSGSGSKSGSPIVR
ncbi:hypothetical protein HYALB_00003072 [Hymenoscyphus albidus]|uniref:Uncharacterized protein n=1 Tax=Hymenoscyphus albidus TaxID=595503 RepID=A0A9N9LUI2_9HELO|nr:hypothetical protein HYALB_00003072 [Hymenoscyphus albidus]